MGRVENQVLVVAALCLAGCGSGDPPAHSPTGPEGCQLFMDAWCNKSADCVVSTERARTLEDCLFVNQLAIDCTEVRTLSASFDFCLQEVGRLSCAAYDPSTGFPAPSSCRGILLK